MAWVEKHGTGFLVRYRLPDGSLGSETGFEVSAIIGVQLIPRSGALRRVPVAIKSPFDHDLTMAYGRLHDHGQSRRRAVAVGATGSIRHESTKTNVTESKPLSGFSGQVTLDEWWRSDGQSHRRGRPKHVPTFSWRQRFQPSASKSSNSGLLHAQQNQFVAPYPLRLTVLRLLLRLVSPALRLRSTDNRDLMTCLVASWQVRTLRPSGNAENA